MNFLDKYRGPDFCPECGEKIMWIRLITGMWIAVQEIPVLYAPGSGKMWLIDGRWDASICKNAQIYRKGIGIKRENIATGYEPHVFKCPMNDRQRYKKQGAGA